MYAILSMQKKLRVLTIRTLVVSRVLAYEFVYRRIDLKMWLLYVRCKGPSIHKGDIYKLYLQQGESGV